MILGKLEKASIEKSNSKLIETAFGELADNFLSARFLRNDNYLAPFAAKIIDKQYAKRPRRRKKHLSKNGLEYIAASTILHNMDGWVYFGHALSSLLKGDSVTSKHLLYYSELRSCMSLLACQGIGVFNSRHLTTTKNGKSTAVNAKIFSTGCSKASENIMGTHNFAWSAFDHVISLDNKVLEIFQAINIESYSLNDWLDAFGVTRSHKISIYRLLLKEIGFDLKYFTNDKNARNEVSYRPTRINPISDFEFLEFFIDVNSVWELSKPINPYGEMAVDLILLSRIIQIAFRQTHPFNKTFKSARRQFKNKIVDMLNNFGLSESKRNELSKIFMSDKPDVFNHLLLDDINNPSFLKGMIYRSFLLLRLSNSSCRRILKENPSIEKDELRFWWKPLGEDLGLWGYDLEPNDFSDLWIDIEDASASINQILSKANISTNSFWQDYGNLGFLLGSNTRAGLWGLGI